MQPYPRAPDLVWPGHLHGAGCLSAWAVGTGFPTVGLRWWLSPGCGWSWVLFSPARRGWGLGWVCLGSVCGVVPLLPAVCGVRGWALVSARFRDVCGFVRVYLAPRHGVGVRAGPGSRLCPALLGWVVGVCFFFFFCFFFFSGCSLSPSRAFWSLPPSPFLFGWAAGFFFFFFFCLFRCPFSRWAAVPGLVLPVFAGWSPCACLGVLSSVLSGGGVWPPFVFLAGGLVAVGSFRAAPLSPPPFFFLGGGGGGGGGGLAVSPFAFPRLALALWLVCGVVGPSPLLAEVPVCYSPPLLAGFRCRWWWAVPATPGWGPFAAVVCGVWCVAVVCWWGCGWCVVWLVPRHSWRRFLCATPRHSWLGFAGGGGVWCVVCGVWRWCVVGVVVGVCCGWSLATPGGGPCVLLPATPGWVSLAAVVCGVWCVVCGGGVLLGLWMVCGVVGPSPLLAEVPVCYSPPLLAGFRCRWRWAFPATPGWGPLAAVVCGVWCVVCGGGVLLGLWLVCGVVGPSPLLAVVPVCYSPPFLAGFRCRWWWAVPATPGWGPLAAVVCGVWCVAVVCWWGCGWCVVWLVPRHSWRRFLCATPRHSWLGFAGGGGVWCVVCGVWRWCVVGVVVGVWCGWSLATPGGGPCVLLPATSGWVSLAAVVCGVWCVVCGGGVLLGLWLVCGVVGPSPLLAEVPVCYSPPLLAGFRCRWRWAFPATPGWGPLAAVVCGVWCVVRGGGVLLGLWLVCGVVGPSPLLAEVPVCYSPPLLAGFRCLWWWAVPATPGWGPLAAVVCGVWCVVCGGGVLLGLWLVCGGGVLLGLWLVCGVVGPSPLLAEVPVCYSPPLLAGFRCRWWWAVPATPGWGPLAAVVCGVWCVVCGGGVLLGLWLVCGGGVLLGLWLVCGVVGPSPLLAEVPVCYSPPLLAGFRCRWWWAVPATPGWGPLAAVACGVCSCACFAWPGRAGRPPGRVLVRLTFSFGRFVFLLCLAPSGPGLPLSLSLLLPFLVGCFSRPPAAWLSVRSRLVCVSRLAVGCSLVIAPPPPSPFVSRGFRRSCLVPSCFFFFFFFPPSSSSSVRPRCLWFALVSGPGCPGPRRLRCLLCLPSVSRLSARLSLFRAFRLVVGCSRVVAAPPPPLCVSRFSFLSLVAVCRVVLCFPGCGAAPRCCALCRPVFCCRVLCCARVVPLLVAPCPLALPVALGPCALRHCVLRCSPALCALCCVCFVVAPWCVLLFAALPCAVCVSGCCAVCVSGCCAVRSLCSPFCAVLCFAVLVRSCCAVRVVRAAAAGAWCCGALLCVVLFPVVCRGAVLGLVARGCLLVACFGVGVPVWPRGLLPCGWCGLLWCPAFLCRVPWCCAVACCCAVVLCRRVAVLLGLALPSCGLSCCAVLCCWLAVLSLARWWCLRAVVLFSLCCAFPVFSALCAAVPCCAGCGALLPCVVCCGAALSCGAVLSCSAVVLRCCLCWLCPPAACRAAPVWSALLLVPRAVACPCALWCLPGRSAVVVLLWWVVVSCCAVPCPVVSCALCRVLRCRAALRCCAVCFSFCPLFLC